MSSYNYPPMMEDKRELVVEAPNGKFSVGDFISYSVQTPRFTGLDADFVGRVMAIVVGGRAGDMMQLQVFRYRIKPGKSKMNEFYETDEIVECPTSGFRTSVMMLHIDTDETRIEWLAQDTFGRGPVAMGEVCVYQYEIASTHLLQTTPTDREKIWTSLNRQPENDVARCCVPAAPTEMSYYWMCFDPADPTDDYITNFYKVNVFDLYCSPLSRSCRRSGRDKNPKQWSYMVRGETPPAELEEQEPMRLPSVADHVIADVAAIRDMAQRGVTAGMFYVWLLDRIKVAERRLDVFGKSAGVASTDTDADGDADGDTDGDAYLNRDVDDFIVGDCDAADDTDFCVGDEDEEIEAEGVVDMDEEEEWISSEDEISSEEEGPWAHCSTSSDED